MFFMINHKSAGNWIEKYSELIFDGGGGGELYKSKYYRYILLNFIA